MNWGSKNRRSRLGRASERPAVHQLRVIHQVSQREENSDQGAITNEDVEYAGEVPGGAPVTLISVGCARR